MGGCPTRSSGGFRSRPKKGLQTALESEVVQEVEALLGREAVAELDFEALEMALRHGTLRLAARAIEQRLNADTLDEVASHVPCRCGGKVHFAGRRSKHFQSVLGPLRLERAYYHCSSCSDGCCPRDKHLGIANTSLSPALTRMTGTVGAMVSFQEGSELLQELAGVDVDTKQVERTAEALGQEIAEDERHHSQPLDALPLPSAALWAKRRHEELDNGQFRALLAAMRRQVVRSEEARRCLHYFKSNRERMRYPEFHAQGLCTSTGVVEAGCKVAIGTRLKRAGMHWTVRGSNAIIALRCSKPSGRFQDFWERRSERLAA